MPSLRGPAPRPCESCPYRRDVPSGVWAQSEYTKLIPFDRVTSEQPPRLFQCHQTERADPKARVCAGWAGVHSCNPRGHELLGLRLAAAFGWLSPDDIEAVATYTTDVPLFSSATVAAAHGMDQVDYPGVAAQRIMAKVLRSGVPDHPHRTRIEPPVSAVHRPNLDAAH